MASKKISELISSSLPPLSGTTTVVYSGVTHQSSLRTLRQQLVDSGSHVFTGSQTINGDLIISGTLTAQQYILSSSISNITTETISGSSNFGNTFDDTHNFTGSVNVTGSVYLKNYLNVSGSGSFDTLHVGIGDIDLTGDANQRTTVQVNSSGSINNIDILGNHDYYTQINLKNTNSGPLASGDIVVTADNGTEGVHYVDLGINSSTYNGGVVGYANDAYLLNVGKDLYLGTIGGTSHPAKLYLFANNAWNNPQVTVHTGSEVTFNTSSFTEGYTYEFSGSVKIDGSLYVSDLTGSLDYSNLINVPTLISGSSQISYSGITDIPNGIISGSEQLPSGLVSGSSQISYTGITNTPNNLISGSSQIVELGFAITGSNTFVGNQTISGSIILENGAVIKDNVNNSVLFGYQAAETNQGTQSVAIGNGAGNYNQSHGTIAIGASAGSITQGLRAVALGALAGANTQGQNAIAIGTQAGGTNQGDYSIALGYWAGRTNQASHSIVFNATGNDLDNTITSSLVIAPIRNTTGGDGILQYDNTTKEVSYSNDISNFVGNLATTGSNTFVGDQTINGSLTIESVNEILTVDGGFTGNRDFDYTSGSIFYLTGLTGNGTWNITNVPTTNNRGTTMTFVVNQDSTAYSASAYSINSSAVTVKWVESTVPTGSANKVDIIGLTAFRVGSSWNVVGSLSSFGS